MKSDIIVEVPLCGIATFDSDTDEVQEYTFDNGQKVHCLIKKGETLVIRSANGPYYYLPVSVEFSYGAPVVIQLIPDILINYDEKDDYYKRLIQKIKDYGNTTNEKNE